MNSWSGYLRADGSLGVRNRVLVVYTVACAKFVAERIAVAAAHPDVEVIGFEGCTDNDYAVRLLLALMRHPNVGGALAVGLGCEYVQAERLAALTGESGRLSDWFTIQAVGGTKRAIERGVASVRTMLDKLRVAPRRPMTLADLCIGAECGGSDYTSGLAGNVAVGRFFDQLVDAGGTALFEETVEAVGLEEMLSSRGADESAAREVKRACDKAVAYCRSVRQYSISPGNFVGGLSTIEEKSMGAVVKSGSRPIEGVLKVGERPRQHGLWLLDTVPDQYFMQFGITNPNDNEGLTALASCGCHLLLLVTGRGNVVGSAVAPVLKVTGNGATFARMADDMDFNAGPVLDGTQTMTETAELLRIAVENAAAGALTKSEALGHREYFIPYKFQSCPKQS